MTESPEPRIRISALRPHGADSKLSASFDDSGGTIGSGAGSALVLPADNGDVDPHHVDVRCVGGGWRVRNISQSGTMTINGRPLAPGGDLGVDVGDHIGLGSYELRVTPESAPDWRAHARTFDMITYPTTTTSTTMFEPNEGGGTALLPDPFAGTASAGWLADRVPLLDSPIVHHGHADLPVDPLALFSGVDDSWPGMHSAQAADLFGDDLTGFSGPGETVSPASAAMLARPLSESFELCRVLQESIPLPQCDEPFLEPVFEPDEAVSILADPPAPAMEIPRATTSPNDPFAELRAAFPPAATASSTAAPNLASASQRSIDRTADAYGTAGGMRHASLIQWPTRPLPASATDSDHASRAVELELARALLEGARFAPNEASRAGLTPDVVRALGNLARSLLDGRRSG